MKKTMLITTLALFLTASLLGQTDSIPLKVGESSEITFNANGANGFSWRLSSCSPKNTLQQVSFKSFKKHTGPVSKSLTQIFTLKALQAGQATCTFEYISRLNGMKILNTKTQSFTITE